MWGFAIALVAGGAYGALAPIRHDKASLFWKGLLWALGAGVVITLLGLLVDRNPLGVAEGGFFGVLLAFGLVTVGFLVGAWAGDLGKIMLRRRRSPVRRS